MDIDKIFKVPSLPSSSNKRKFGDLPSAEDLKKFRPNDEAPPPPQPSANAKGKQRAVVRDEEDEEMLEQQSGDPYDFAPGGDADYFVDEDEDGGRMFGGGLNEDQKHILDLFDAAGESGQNEEGEITLPALRRQLIQFERAVKKNQEMRVKFPDEPEKFIDSESTLDSSLHSLTLTLPQNPKLFYPEFVKQGSVALLAELLSHENTDIALDVVTVLVELTEEDVEGGESDEEDEEEDEGGSGARGGMGSLIGALLDVNIFELLIANLYRLDEKEEADRTGTFQTLGIFENLLSFNPALAETLVQTTTVVKWVLDRIIAKEYDSNKQYASEILAILLQQSRPNRLAVGSQTGIDVLLRVVAQYRKTDPPSAEEAEFLENAFDALCSLLAEPELKHLFLESEGVELMVICMREKKLARARSIKVLDHALSGREGEGGCERFVEALGLKSLFAAFMGKGNKKSSRLLPSDTEHILGILVSLFTNLASDSAPRIRLLAKFVEGSYEKVDRLLELREDVEGKLGAVEGQIFEERKAIAKEDRDTDEDEEEMFYLRRLEGGLFTLQMIDFILAWLIMEDDGARDQALLLLSRKDQSFQEIIDVLQEQYDNIGDPSPPQEEGEKAREEWEAEQGKMESQRVILEGLMAYLKGLV